MARQKRRKVTKVCEAEGCFEEFKRTRIDHIYCSPACRQRVSRAKRREEKKELVEEIKDAQDFITQDEEYLKPISEDAKPLISVKDLK